jgi:putative transposase
MIWHFITADVFREPKGLPYDCGCSVGQGFSPASQKFKKRIRLKGFSYKGTYRYFVTLCIYNKENVFNDDSLVSSLLDLLRDLSGKFHFRVWAYCFMPDHLHLLIEGKDEASDFKKFISSFKQQSGYEYKKKTGFRLWQVNYYEHVLRKEEGTITIANYILSNPVRKGLVDHYKKYALLGSFEFDVSQT